MRLADLPDSDTFEIINLILEKVEKGERVISLAVGEPMYRTPDRIIEAACRSMKDGETHYTSAAGIPSVRMAISNKVGRKNGIECSPDNCAFMTTKMSIYAALMAANREGRREVLLPNPGFFYREPALLAGLDVHYYGTTDGFTPDVEGLIAEVSKRTAAVMVNDPCNPTGRVFSRNELRSIYEACADSGSLLISDEAYEDLIYEKEHVSAGSFEAEPESVVSLFSLSKSYSMTGWRGGYVVARAEILKQMVRLVEHIYTCSPPFIQKAAEFALDNCDEEVRLFREQFRAKRDFILGRLRNTEGLHINDIDGAFYAFPSYDAEITSSECAKKLLELYGIAVLPGAAFGSEGEGHLRISFSGNIADIGHGIDGVESFLSSLG